MATAKKATAQEELNKLIPLRKATFTEEEKRKLVEGTNAQGKPLTEKEDMELSKMHTARTLGADWRERAAETLRKEESTKAQQALDERAAINRRMQGSQLPSPLQKDVSKTVVDLPGGGKVKFGIDTLARMRGFEEDKAKETQAREAKQKESIYAFSRKSKDTLRKRYEDELMSRGFTPPKTREEENLYNKQRMEEFKLAGKYRAKAEETEKRAVQEYSALKKAAREAKKNKDYTTAGYLQNQANEVNDAAGGNIQNQSARKRFFIDEANKTLMNELKARSDARKAIIQKQTTSNPEAASEATSAPPQPVPVPSPASVPAPPVPAPATKPASRSATPNKPLPAAPSSKDQNIEDVLPGISNMPVVSRNPNETPAQHNARVQEEYANNVIIPSLDETTQNSLKSAIELNKQKDELFKKRFVSKENARQYKDVSDKLEKDQDVLKKTIDKLRSEKRNMSKYPMNSKERQFLDLQIATLQNQLGFFAKRLY
jgi:hypothetical protein